MNSFEFILNFFFFWYFHNFNNLTRSIVFLFVCCLVVLRYYKCVNRKLTNYHLKWFFLFIVCLKNCEISIYLIYLWVWQIIRDEKLQIKRQILDKRTFSHWLKLILGAFNNLNLNLNLINRFRRELGPKLNCQVIP